MCVEYRLEPVIPGRPLTDRKRRYARNVEKTSLGVRDVGLATRFFEAMGWHRSAGFVEVTVAFLTGGGVVLNLFGRGSGSGFRGPTQRRRRRRPRHRGEEGRGSPVAAHPIRRQRSRQGGDQGPVRVRGVGTVGAATNSPAPPHVSAIFAATPQATGTTGRVPAKGPASGATDRSSPSRMAPRAATSGGNTILSDRAWG